MVSVTWQERLCVLYCVQWVKAEGGRVNMRDDVAQGTGLTATADYY